MGTLFYTDDDVDMIKEIWRMSNESYVWYNMDGDRSLFMYNAGGHVGFCATIEEKLELLKQTACNGVWIKYYPNRNCLDDYVIVERLQ